MCKRRMRSVANNAFGIGLRSEHIEELLTQPPRNDLDFLELAPDNWMNIGGMKKQSLDDIAGKYPLIAHGLSLSIGDSRPLNEKYLRNIRDFLDEYQIEIYSDHLCMSSDEQGYMYDLLPIPRTESMVEYLNGRIHQVEDVLDRPLVLENISAYYSYPQDMPEIDFWLSLLEKTGCEMLLDINNVYVNSCNYGYDAEEFIRALPSDQVRYYHIAGHLKEHDILLDTHGRPVEQKVIELANYTWCCHGDRPLLLERDHHIPPLETLCAELGQIKQAVSFTGSHHAKQSVSV